MRKRKEAIKIICYGQEEIYTDRKKAMQFYMNCADNSEGSERERYINILFDLMDGKSLCTDGWYD